jgi:Bacteriophage baseplate protein W
MTPFEQVSQGPFLDFPLDVAGNGTLRTTDPDDHLRDLILQVLLTEPGERVNLPDFGCGLKRLMFAPSDEIVRSTTQFLVTENLERWLGDRIELEDVAVTSEPGEEERIQIEVAYVVRQTQAVQRLKVEV